MNPHSKPRPLLFTPRSPWGRLPLKRAHQSHMRASEDAEKAKALYLNPGPDVKNPTGLFIRPEIDSKNPDGKPEVKVDIGKSFKFPWEVKQEENDRLRKENNAKIKAEFDKTQQQQSGASDTGAGKTPHAKTPSAKTPPAMSPEEIDEYEKQRKQAFQDSDWKKAFYK